MDKYEERDIDDREYGDLDGGSRAAAERAMRERDELRAAAVGRRLGRPGLFTQSTQL